MIRDLQQHFKSTSLGKKGGVGIIRVYWCGRKENGIRINSHHTYPVLARFCVKGKHEQEEDAESFYFWLLLYLILFHTCNIFSLIANVWGAMYLIYPF